MDKLLVEGGRPLEGTVRVSGAKNAALPLLAATLLAPGEHRLANLPALQDVETMLSLLGRLGCPSLVGPTLRIETSRLFFCEAPFDLVRRMRASVLVLGPLLARCGEAHVSLPGGCAIGVRPIDQHLKGLEALGCRFELEGGTVHGRTDRLRGAEIAFDMPTVTGTENVLMAAVLAEGDTIVRNAAMEPEVADLARFLRSLGAVIEGEGTPEIRVRGVPGLAPSVQPYRILPDRIEAGTYLVAGAITGGSVTCTGTRPGDLAALLDVLSRAGCEVHTHGDAVTVARQGPIRPVDVVTAPHPGFPTDMQAQVMALLTLAEGSSHVTETIFENRFMHVAELLRLGASIHVHGNQAIVTGVERLKGAAVVATDLRASAGLVLAALSAEGTSEILHLDHLDRGYEALVPKLQGIGARVFRLDLEDRGIRPPTDVVATA
ncbi:MAG: UDP-N-acetylglucosamine 1-carboxyvinyltransferase [Deltaproteobacteria bacterium]|nr:UDP-N-acetylglucosamine 1-carboxyvinyltransferase [Deltaproteobacteria bacterium]